MGVQGTCGKAVRDLQHLAQPHINAPRPAPNPPLNRRWRRMAGSGPCWGRPPAQGPACTTGPPSAYRPPALTHGGWVQPPRFPSMACLIPCACFSPAAWLDLHLPPTPPYPLPCPLIPTHLPCPQRGHRVAEQPGGAGGAARGAPVRDGPLGPVLRQGEGAWGLGLGPEA